MKWKVFVMVQRIDNNELMTCVNAKRKYSDKYIGFVTTEQNMADPDNELGYVVYLADFEDELNQIPTYTDDDEYISIMTGFSVIDDIRVGVAIFDD